MNPPNEDLFFVGIANHSEVRKELLVSSKNLLSSLKQYEHFVALKEDKAQVVKDLQKVFGEIISLNRKLRSFVPKMPNDKQKMPSGKLEILEDELARVEKRLNSL